MRFKSQSARATKNLARTLGRKILKSGWKNPGALIIALTGELGSGKTTFVQGFVKALGIKKRIVSPTFLIMRSYQINRSGLKRFFHVDAYRLKNSRELQPLGFREVIRNRRHIVLIEWAENIKRILPSKTILVEFSHGARSNERIINTKGT